MKNNYQQWMDYESLWIAGYRKKVMRTTTHVTIPVVMAFLILFLGGMSFLDRMDPADAFYGGLGGLLLGTVVCLPFYLLLRFGLRDSKYRRLVEKAVEAAGIPDGELETLGAEMLAARDDSSQQIFFEMTGPGSNHTPARFVRTPHYAYLAGGYPYAILVRLSDMVEIRPSQEKKLETRRGAKTRTVQALTLYTIGFYRRDRADRGLGPDDLPDEAMGFFSQQIRDKAMELLNSPRQ